VEFSGYVSVLLRRWRLIAVCALIAIILSALVTVATPRTYSTEAQLFVAAQDQNSVSNAYQGGLFSQQRVKSYADIVNSPPVMEAVIQQLGLPITPQALAGQVTANAPIDTVLINIVVKDRSPRRAQLIAIATCNQFVQFIDLVERSPTAPSPIKVTVVKPAPLPASPVSPRKSLNLALGVLAGLATGAAGAALRETLNTSPHPSNIS